MDINEGIIRRRSSEAKISSDCVEKIWKFKEESGRKIDGIKMIDIKNSSTDYLQRTSGTFNNISMLFAGKF